MALETGVLDLNPFSLFPALLWENPWPFLAPVASPSNEKTMGTEDQCLKITWNYNKHTPGQKLALKVIINERG